MNTIRLIDLDGNYVFVDPRKIVSIRRVSALTEEQGGPRPAATRVDTERDTLIVAENPKAIDAQARIVAIDIESREFEKTLSIALETMKAAEGGET